MPLIDFSPQKVLYLHMIPYVEEEELLVIKAVSYTMIYNLDSGVWDIIESDISGRGIESLVRYYESHLMSSRTCGL